MKAIEFIAKAVKGSIKIPKQYQEQLNTEFRVIILQETATSEKKASKKKVSLSAPKIKTKGFKFSREEAKEINKLIPLIL